jgi:uncharacterized membrane protein YgcG
LPPFCFDNQPCKAVRISLAMKNSSYDLSTAVRVLTIAALLSILLGARPAVATWCSTSAQCSRFTVCQPSWVPFLKECRQLRCNFDVDCPNSRPLCRGGICIRPAQSGGGQGGGGGGGSQPGVGQRCGEVTFGGGVKKHVGCPAHLQCVHDRCQRPPT